MIVDLAVVDDPEALVLVRHRLVAEGGVDDREPPVGKSDRPLEPQPLTIGPPMANHVAHALEPRLVHRLAGDKLQNARNATHGRLTDLNCRPEDRAVSQRRRRGVQRARDRRAQARPREAGRGDREWASRVSPSGSGGKPSRRRRERVRVPTPVVRGDPALPRLRLALDERGLQRHRAEGADEHPSTVGTATRTQDVGSISARDAAKLEAEVDVVFGCAVSSSRRTQNRGFTKKRERRCRTGSARRR